MEPQFLAAYKAVAAEIDEAIESFLPLVGSELPADVFGVTLLALSHCVVEQFGLADDGSMPSPEPRSGQFLIEIQEIKAIAEGKSVEAMSVKYH
jgi:hypothetical protein